MVTYGGMSREPISLPTSVFIFRNLSCKGFWMAHWKEMHAESQSYTNMVTDLCNYMEKGFIQEPFHNKIEWDAETSDESHLLNAIEMSQKPMLGKKVILVVK
jgi:hypothetical protein